jgi:hypothetical protein
MLHTVGITIYCITNVTLTQRGDVITMGEIRNAYRILAYIVLKSSYFKGRDEAGRIII